MNKKDLKILQLNKGDAQLSKRVPHINAILEQYKPNILILNELNLHHMDTITGKLLPGYKLLTDNLNTTDTRSRTGMLIQTDLKHTRRQDLESPGTSTIWIQLNNRGSKPLLIQGLYRQFTRINTPNSNTPKQQTKRWTQIVDKWELALQEQADIIAMGDCNLNQDKWNKQEEQMNTYEKSQAPMVRDLKARILDNGIVVLNKEHTWNLEPNSLNPSCLDLIITNRRDKVTSYSTIYPTFSNHAMLELNYKVREVKTQSQYIKTRNLKNYSRTLYKEAILNHPLYVETHYEGDPDTIAQNLRQIIRQSLDPLAPPQRIQLKPAQKPKLSEEARDLLARRDLAYTNYKTSKDPEDFREYKNLRNQTTTTISKENHTQKTKNLRNPDLVTYKQKWDNLKNHTGQKTFTTPSLIREGDKNHTAPRDMAQALNRQYLKGI